jgi:hypothetical protein
LYERQQQAAATALETNTANQKLLHDLLAKVEQQMAVVRQARKALHGYGHGVGAGKKTRKILSGEL